MKKLALLTAWWVCLSLAARAQSRAIEVTTNRNVEVINILFTQLSPEFLADSLANPWMFENTRLMRASYDFFQPWKQHPAVAATDALSKSLGTGVYLLGLYYEPIPEASPKSPLSPLLLEAVHPNSDSARHLVNSYMNLLNRFYREAPVDSFLRTYDPVYQTALQEVKSQLPASNFIPTLEAYYGERKNGYTIVVMPFFKSQWGMGWQVGEAEKQRLFNIIAPFDAQYWASKHTVKTAGYQNPEALRTWCVHEFGHSFVNPLTAQKPYAQAIDAHKGLFKPIANNLQYSDWATAFNEYVVRAGEVQVAGLMGQHTQKKRLLAQYRDWIYLPHFNRQLAYYRANRKQYPTFKSFLPKLIDSLSARR